PRDARNRTCVFRSGAFAAFARGKARGDVRRYPRAQAPHTPRVTRDGQIVSAAGPPAVSVIMPTFNRREFLEPAIASVFAQTFEDWELIIADDGSSEPTRGYLRALRHPRVRLISMP